MAKYEEWLQDDKLILIQGWIRSGLNDKQVAKNMGIGISTFYEWKNKFVDFADIIKKTKEVVDYEVENSLYKRAMGYAYEEKIIELKYDKETNQYVEMVTKRIQKTSPPDTMALIYWLNNRMPSEWKNKQEIVTTNFENFETLAEKLKIKESE